MGSSLRKLIDVFRSESKTEREKGNYFENLCKLFLENDSRYANQFEKVYTYSQWAEIQNLPQNDNGVDLVAKIKGEDNFCAIQCKLYADDVKLYKDNINSFFTELGKKYFSRGLFIDISAKDWSKNAEATLYNQSKPVNRITLEHLETSNIDWNKYLDNNEVVTNPKKELRPHQQAALDATKQGFLEADRGKLIMACGTGKTFTSLKIAEELAGAGKRVLFAVPSIALMSQTITEWIIETKTPIQAFSVCSDTSVGKRKSKPNEESVDTDIHDLAYPATTQASKLAINAEHIPQEHMQVVFCTYQSMQVIIDAQAKHNLADFDLIICDEAHRTTGTILENKQESNFTKIHSNDNIKAKKRLYMTATPRLYGEGAKKKANQERVILCSMDDEQLYGQEFYNLKFSEAVDLDLLTDYKVIVLAVNEEYVARNFQTMLANEEGLKLDDATKLVGCYKALTKQDFKADILADTEPMQRAVAFCRSIAISKAIKTQFTDITKKYTNDLINQEETTLHCNVDHVDGSMSAKIRNNKIAWLKDDLAENECRILSNARCLSEGVDVPALDAILFMHPRNSMVDVVQSVGRVMRRAEGKHLGYVILPIAVPAGVEPEEHLNNSEAYQTVWQVLNALRSHDERLDAEINKIDLSSSQKKIDVIGVGFDDDSSSESSNANQEGIQLTIDYEFDDLKKAIYAKLVKKCGTRSFWMDWAADIAKIAKAHITRITAIVEQEGSKEQLAFNKFLTELKDDLNESISKDDAIEMLAQHMITKPVFDALFEGYSFTSKNPVSIALNNVLVEIDPHNIQKEAQELQKFYQSVQTRAEGIDSLEGKQKIIIELYDKFFKTAFPRTTEKLGIVYTPVEVVDFIIHSVNDTLKAEFGETLGSKNVHILDPFTGTGTFITRLMQSGLITKEELAYKYKNEIHANEIVLLAYYIASINIEQVYHDIMGGDYEPFNGICLTDTFAMQEHDVEIFDQLVDNSNRLKKQKSLPVKIIIGNPPYSAGQTTANDNNANVKYPLLDKTIEDTYVKYSTATNKNSLYDSYIRAIRWASTRVKDNGIVGFITNAGFLDSAVAAGVRKCLAEEFSNIYIFDLKGAVRGKSGDAAKKTGGNVFDIMTGVCITILVKNQNAESHGNIYYHDIGDYLTREEKLQKIIDFKSITGIKQVDGFEQIIPDKFNDWLNQRDESFNNFIELGNKKDKQAKTIFANYSRGIATARDSWAYNSSKTKLAHNMQSMINFYNSEMERYQAAVADGYNGDVKGFLNYDATKIAWGRDIINRLIKNNVKYYEQNNIINSLYRPFSKQHLYFDRYFNDMVYQMPQIFPKQDMENLVICVSITGGKKDFMPLIANCIPDLHFNIDSQCFPLKLYVSSWDFDYSFGEESNYSQIDAITDYGLNHFSSIYGSDGNKISKEDLFYYIYGLLHSKDYRKKYAMNLTKQLPRIPRVASLDDFWSFSKAGRDLAKLHINYETVEKYPLTIEGAQGELLAEDNQKLYYVTKMKFAKKGKEVDKTKIIYNSNIKISNIPEKAYRYVINGKSPIEWAMDRQGLKIHKDSQIINDANDYAIETMQNPAYPLELIQRLVTVSLKTLDIIDSLPKLNIYADDLQE